MKKRHARLALLSLACILLMSFKVDRATDDLDPLHYDVRSAFVTSRSDIPADLMHRVHHRVSAAINSATHSQVKPRVILAIRLAPLTQSEFLFGERASSRVTVRATSVSSGEIVAEAKFLATAIAWSKSAALEKLGDGIAQQVIREFRLTPFDQTTVMSALTPMFAK